MAILLEEFGVSISVIDCNRFGIAIAKAFVTDGHEIDAAIRFCKKNDVKMLILRCMTSSYSAVGVCHAMGMSLLDTLVHYKRDIQKNPFPYANISKNVREFVPDDIGQICEITRESFANYPGHYQLDTRLNQSDCQAIYVDWARRSCMDKDVADHILVYEDRGILVAYLTLKQDSSSLELVLSGVSKSHQGKGIYNILIQAGIALAQKNSLQCVYTSTQLPNIAVQKAWIRCGMEPFKSYYTFHHWFD